MTPAVRVSVGLSCGCSWRPSKDLIPASAVMDAGKVVICDRHDDYAIVIRVTAHLAATPAQAAELFGKHVDPDTAQALAAEQFRRGRH